MKKKASGPQRLPNGPDLFAKLENRRRRVLFLPRFLAEEAGAAMLRGKKQEHAFEVLSLWADLVDKGHLTRKKETSLNADFLHQVFGDALGYQLATQNPEHYQLEREFPVPGVGTADGALGNFSPGTAPAPVAVIELKGATVDLDRDKSNGRTAVQQCWDYLNALPGCPWGIVSNFHTLRLYHRARTPLAYEEFQLGGLRKRELFLAFYFLLETGGLLPSVLGEPRALKLLERTSHRQREVGDELYLTYSEHRWQLIDELHRAHGKSLDEAIRIAQILLDRIIFVAFCEDRGLLPEKCIEMAYSSLPPFSKVTNPRWQNFLALFQTVDKGHSRDLNLENGYNGGLFRHDPAVDDLQLDDKWTQFFRTLGHYDFRDEVNVEVLGHLFEKSIGELEGLRAGGLFALAGPEPVPRGPQPAMPKSPERKRFGIYYTPPEFTQFIARTTIEPVLHERFAQLRRLHRVTDADLESGAPSPTVGAYFLACLEALRQVKVCDPACGSGAFLVQAYDLLEEHYIRLADDLRPYHETGAEEIADQAPDWILADNLYGVDLSRQSVEITQLALWIRSARRGKTLADLSHNIMQGNSLVTDLAVHALALDWRAAFDKVFNRLAGGFDCIIGNPPWERLKLQEREFFAFAAPQIANAVSAAKRRELVADLETKDPELFARYTAAKEAAERTLAHVRTGGAFPLTGRGDINTYMLFAELARRLVAPAGRVGLLVPSGIATDNTTREFFNELMASQALIKLYDFENRQRIFPDVDGRFKFCVLVFGGAEVRTPHADFVFFAHTMDDLKPKNRHIVLSSADLALLNPNTHTCPIFRSRRDAELTKGIYRRVPVLIDESRQEGGNPWGIRFVTMFHQTNDAGLFHDAEQLNKLGCKLVGNRWTKGKVTYLPLYEAKMVQAYDHRAASVKVVAGNWVRQGQTEDTTLVEHQNPEFVVQPRWWVNEEEVLRARGATEQPAYLCFKDVTSPTNQRTMIAALIPPVAVVNSAPLMVHSEGIAPRLLACLLANLNTLVLDFVARQKVGGLHLNFFIVNQLPLFPPEHYAKPCPWSKRTSLEKWISERVLKLSCTANDLKPFGEAAGFDPPVHRWDPDERAELLAELDAAFFILYGVGREDVEHILGTFAGLREQAEGLLDKHSTVGRILAVFDRLSG